MGKLWDIDVVTTGEDGLGASPLWHPREKALYWLDGSAPCLHRLDPAGGERRSLPLPAGSAASAIVLAGRGELVAVLPKGLHLVDTAKGTLTFLVDPAGGRFDIGYNDAKVDRRGRLWVGTLDREGKEPRGILHLLVPGALPQVGDSGFVVCGGPAFSPDGGILYLSDSLAHRILRYELDPRSGRLLNRRLFAAIPAEAGAPGGLTVDAEGFLWCAHQAGGRVTRFSPAGKVDRLLALPVPHVTGCCFGGPDLKTLYLTTARAGMSDADLAAAPLAGSLFRVETDLRGLEELPYAGT